jgi:hypothetical protein
MAFVCDIWRAAEEMSFDFSVPMQDLPSSGFRSCGPGVKLGQFVYLSYRFPCYMSREYGVRFGFQISPFHCHSSDKFKYV